MTRDRRLYAVTGMAAAECVMAVGMFDVLPLWVCAGVVAVGLGAMGVVWLGEELLEPRREWRRRRGLCAECGYDLRGSGGRCPECERGSSEICFMANDPDAFENASAAERRFSNLMLAGCVVALALLIWALDSDSVQGSIMPCGFLVGLAGILPVMWIWGRKARLREKREESGRCPECGYDLRASAGRCPECGREIVGRRNIRRG